MNKKAITATLLTLIMGLSISNAQAQILCTEDHDFQAYDFSDCDLKEHETLLYQAEVLVHSAATQQNIGKLAGDAITTCYNAYKSNFDRAIAQEKAKLAGTGSLNSSYAKIMPVQHAISFATSIINQIDILAQKLSPADKKTFWNISEQEIVQILTKYCAGHGATSTGELNTHIANLIQMKKMFG